MLLIFMCNQCSKQIYLRVCACVCTFISKHVIGQYGVGGSGSEPVELPNYAGLTLHTGARESLELNNMI